MNMVAPSAMSRRKHKAYSYLRFSTPEQERGDSFRRQSKMAEAYAQSYGLELSDESFQDLGVSGYRGKNVETGRLADFLEAARAGTIPDGSFLLVESLDRISRAKPRRAMSVLGDICAEGITLVTLDDGQQYTDKSLDDDPMAFLFAFVKAMRANEESATKARRLQAAWSNKRAQADGGHILTSLCPAWLELDREAGKFKLIPARVRTVKRIFKMALAGKGQHAIAELLNREKVPPFGRAAYWQRSYIAKVLSNPAVIGTFTPHTMVHEDGRKVRHAQRSLPNYFPSAISAAQFEAVQSLRSELGAPQRGRHSKKPLANIFGGLARCPVCAGAMTLKNKGGDYRYLVCSRAAAQGGCKQGRVRYGVVEAAFIAGVDEAMADCPSDDLAAAKMLKEVRNLETAIDAAHDQIEDLATAAGLGKLGTAHTINDRIVKLERGVAEMRIERDRKAERAESLTGAVLKKRLATLSAALEARPLNRGAVNVALRPLVSGVEVDYKAGYLYLHWKHGGQPGAILYDGAAIFAA